MNHHLKDNYICHREYKPTFKTKIGSSVDNLQTGYEWFMKWEDSDVDYEKKKTMFSLMRSALINMRSSSWAKESLQKGKQRADEIIIEKLVVEYVKFEHIDGTVKPIKAPSKDRPIFTSLYCSATSTDE
ncbi:hypothetical protein BD770DRAFT_427090 [Pilaira anomala]|nr:hypothetical protein BD770DRAFT_427090 [Pilaira anomala]